MREGLRSGNVCATLQKEKTSASYSQTGKKKDDKKKIEGFNLKNPILASACQELVGKKEDDPEKKGDLNELISVPNSPGSEKETLGIKTEEKRDGSKGDDYEESGGTEDMGKVVGSTGNKRKTGKVDSGEGIEENSVEKKRVKKDGLDCKEQIVGKVLPSRSGGEKENNRGESGGDGVGGKRTRGCDGSDKKMAEVGEDESAVPVGRSKKLKRRLGRPPKVRGSNEVVEEDEGDRLVRKSKGKLKRRPGRPPKVQGSNVVSEESNGDRLVRKSKGKLKRRRGRPPKVQGSNGVSEEDNGDQLVRKSKGKLKRRPGRPLKVQESNGVSEEDEGDRLVRKSKKKLKRKRGEPLKLHGSNRVCPKEADEEEKKGKLRENEDNVKQILSAEKNKFDDLETEDTVDSSSFRSKEGPFSSNKKKGNEGGKIKQKGDVECSRSAAKQLVRDRIVKLLLSAGWTIEYRPRNGKDYNDAVYVNPEGRTHWSVTLAYRKFRKQYEDGEHDSNTSKTSFTFTAIPEEDLSILTKVITKKRESKKKLNQKGKGGKKTDGAIEKKRLKESLTPMVDPGGKLLKERMKGKHSRREHDNLTGASEKGMLSGRNRKRLETQYRNRCALLVRSSMEGDKSDNDGYILYNGKRNVLSWMIDMGTVPLNGKVQYMNQRKEIVLLEGKITRDGIHCDCCRQIITITKFETHAGSKLHKPFQNIYLETGASLLQCQLDSWNKQEEFERKWFHFIDVEGEDPNDDTCGICGDGGDLICCDGCPSVFHQNCLDIQEFPSGDWHCVYCSCKFCWMVDRSTYQRDDDNDMTASPLLTCHLCEEKYHNLCILARDAIEGDPSRPSFCGKNCQELFERLQMLLGVKHELEEGFSWSLIQRCDSEIHQKIECNSKLAVALSVMDECFLPMIDHRSGVNLIRNILYNCGSNFNRLNYSGFFTVILERSDEIICVASIRIHGNQLAEMPFIGTRHMYRHQGMCRRLLAAIESFLCSLNVEELVIPAISEVRKTWTSVFGFKPIEVSSKQKMRNMNMLVFPGVDILHKPLLNHPKDVTIPFAGLNSSELRKELQTVTQVANTSNDSCSADPDLNISSEGTAWAHKIIDEPTAVKYDLQLHNGSSNDTSDITSETVIFTEHAADMNCLAQQNTSVDNLEGENKTMGYAHKLSEEISKHQNAVSAGLDPDQNTVECPELNQHNIPGLESKADVVSCIGSAATKCEGQPLSNHPEEVTIPSAGLNSSDLKRGHQTMNEVANTSNDSCSAGPDLSISSKGAARAHKIGDEPTAVKSHSPRTENVACELKTEDSIVKEGSCEVGVDDQKEVPTADKTNFRSVDGDLIPDKPQTNSKASEQPESGSLTDQSPKPSEQPGSVSHIDQSTFTQCNSETLSNSNSGSDVVLCGTPEVLSSANQAS